MSRRTQTALILLAALGWIALAVANLFFGELNQDEGWYLYAARLVSEGQLPFRDFAFTQGPMLPLVYAMGHGLVAQWGLAGGRVVTALFGLFAAMAAASLAARITPERKAAAAIFTFILIALNVYHSYFTTVVKTYSLCALFLTTGFVFVARGRLNKSALFFACSGIALAAAAATRITAGFSLAVVGIWLLASRKTYGDKGWLAFGLGGVAGLALFLGSFYALAPESFQFFLMQYHSYREAGGGLLATFAFKVGLVSRVVQAYFVAVAIGVVLVVAKLLGFARNTGPRDGLVISGWITLIGITFVQACAPFPYDDYQVPLFPLYAALLAAALFRLPAFSAPRPTIAVLWIVLLLSGASAISSPVNQNWMIVGRDRIWWKMRERPALLQLRDAAQEIKKLAGDSNMLLTQDTYLAVETGMRVPRGWEMGIFSYYPDWPREKAERLHVLSSDMLRADLGLVPANVVALSDYAFSVAAPAVAPLPEKERDELLKFVETRYTAADEIPYFGQGNTTLHIFSREP